MPIGILAALVLVSLPQTPVPRKRPSQSDQQPRLQDTVRLSADGLAKVLGDLEARVLRTVWHFGGPVPARAVFEHATVDHPVSPLTVIIVLNKLVDKRILDRRKQGDLYHHSPRMTEAEFATDVSRRMVEGILSFSPDAVAASMVDVLAERDPSPEHATGVVGFIRPDPVERRARRLVGEETAPVSRVTRGSLWSAALVLVIVWAAGIVHVHPLPHSGRMSVLETHHCDHQGGSMLSHLFCRHSASGGWITPADLDCPHRGAEHVSAGAP